MPASQNISFNDVKSIFLTSVDINYSSIDLAADLHLSSEKYSYVTNKQRFQFPATDTPISTYVDNRSDLDKFRDILQIVNSKLQPDMAELWSEVCQYDVKSPCYYKSGMQIGISQMRDLAKEFKLKNTIVKDNLPHMPEILKNMEHSKSCQSQGKKFNENDKCNYASAMRQECVHSPSSEEKSNISLKAQSVEKSNVTATLDANSSEKYLLMSSEAKILLKKCGPNGEKLKDKSLAMECIDYITNYGHRNSCKKLKKIFLKGKQLSKRLRKHILHKLTFEMEQKNKPIEEVYVTLDREGQTLPFINGFIEKSKKTQRKEGPSHDMKQLLADSGSDLNLLSYTEYKKAGWDENRLIKTPNIKLRGSTGVIPDSFLGKFSTNIFLVDEQGGCKKFKVEFYVTHPKLGLNITILGGPFFSNYQGSISYPLPNKIEVFLKRRVDNKHIMFPANKISYKRNHSVTEDLSYQSVSMQEKFDNYLSYSFFSDDKHIQKCQALQGLKIGDEFFLMEKSNDEKYIKNEQKKISLFSLPDNEKTKMGSNDNFTFRSENEHSRDPNYGNENSNESEEIGEEEILGSLLQQHLSQYTESKNENEEEDVRNFLSETIDSRETGADVEQTLEKYMLDKVSIDTTSCPKNEVDDKLLAHLSKGSKAKVEKVINKFGKLWATSKYQIGSFNGFTVRIDTVPGSTAFQKERRQNRAQEEAITKTVEGFTESGLFEPSPSQHEKYCANLNIVPKIVDGSELRFLTKADKYIAKHTNKELQNQSTGFRAAIDLTTLNSIIPDTGKLSLPSISEIQTKTRDCLVSTIDLSNQFFSIHLEPSSRSKTNFYFRGKVLRHTRLPQGLKSSPYLATQAMNYTFGKMVFRKFLQEKGINPDTFIFQSFDQFSAFYLDDVILYTAKDLSIPSLNMGPEEVHLLLVEAILWALETAGWIANKNKLSLLTTKFNFLGQVIDTTTNSSSMQDIRVQSILNWRSPRSRAEAGSRISVISYYSKFCVWLRLLALPILAAMKRENFTWGKLEEEAFRNILFVISLQIKMSHFNPDWILLITTDASHVAINASYFNFHPKSGELQLFDTVTKIFSGGELRHPPVSKECLGLMYALTHGESYIRANNTATWVFSDASSLQHIQRTKIYNAKQFNNSIFISSLPRVNFFYVSGRSLLLSDILTRQFQRVYTNSNNISKELAEAIPPLKALKIQNFEKLDPSELRKFILSYPRNEIVDVWSKRGLYTQDLSKNQLQNFHQNISNEKQLIISLSLGWDNPEILKSLDVWKDLMRTKKISEPEIKAILKVTGMNKLHQKIQDLNLDSKILTEELEKYHFGAENKSFAMTANTCDCKNCTKLKGNLFIDEIASKTLTDNAQALLDFISDSKALLGEIFERETNQFFSALSRMSCPEAKTMLIAAMFQNIQKKLSENKFQGTKRITIIPFYKSDKIRIILSGKRIKVLTNSKSVIPPLGFATFDIDLILGTPFMLDNLEYDQENLVALQWPENKGFVKTFQKCSFFNLNDTEHIFEENSTLFEIVLDDQEKDEGIIMVKTEKELLKEMEFSLQNSQINNTLTNMEKIVGEVVSFHGRTTQAVEDKNLMKNVEKRKALVGISSKTQESYQSMSQKLNKLMIAQSLVRNQNLFNEDMIKGIQQDDEFCKVMSDNLKEKNDKASKDFKLCKEILYKKSKTMGQDSSKLVIPEFLAIEILRNLHVKFNLHFSNQQMMKLYNLNFYTPNISNLMKKVKESCSVCILTKRNYKRKVSGSKREFEDSIQPGQHIQADVMYLPKDKNNYKFCLIIIDRLTSYLSCFPLKELSSASCTEALKNYLSCFPPPETLSTDGDGVFSSVFQKTCNKYNIFLKTNIPKNSNSIGSAEVGIRIFRDLAIKTAHQTVNGRSEWSTLLPLIIQSYNNRPPYNLEISRSHLFLSPYFRTNVSFLFAPPVQENFDRNGADLIQSTFLKLNKKRKNALTNLKSRYACPTGLKVGHIVTEASSKSEKEQMDSTNSSGLTPSPQKLFKVLEVKNGGTSAHCINLKTGQKLTHALSNLQPLSVESIGSLNLDMINPVHSFEKIFHQSRLKNLYGFDPNVNESLEEDAVEEDVRRTRSGNVFNTIQVKDSPNQAPILKVKLQNYTDLEKVDRAQLLAIKRAAKTTEEVGLQLSKDQRKAKNWIHRYNLAKIEENRPKIRSKRRISFDVSTRSPNDSKAKERSFTSSHFMKLILNPLDISFKELDCLPG